MKIVVAGEHRPGSLESFLADGLARAGCDARVRRWEPPPLEAIASRMPRHVLDLFARRQVRAASSEGADVVVVVKAALWGPGALARARSRLGSARLVQFLPDDPLHARAEGHYHRAAVDALPGWDLVVTWTRDQEALLRGLGVGHVGVVPFGWAPEHRSPHPTESVGALECDSVFIGTWDPNRERILRELCERHPELRLLIAGNFWNRARSFGHSVRIIARNLYGVEAVRLARSGALALNIPRPQNVGNHNMRYFELAAMGVVQVAALSMSPPPGAEELAVDASELAGIVEASRDPRWLVARREAVWSAAIGHSYADRASDLVSLLAP